MSEICPTTSQQLAAAAIAFHRARRKFSENPSEPVYKNSERIQACNKTENSTRLRIASGFCCGRNSESFENPFHQEKRTRDSVRDFVKTVSRDKYSDASGQNEPDKYKDAEEKLDVSSETNELRSSLKKNCVCCHQKLDDGDSINHFQKTGFPTIGVHPENDSGNDDESLDFPQKLYEWERRSREESLMKMQRLYQRNNRMKHEPRYQSLFGHFHCCQMHHCTKISAKPINSILCANWSSMPARLLCPKFLHERKCEIERQAKDYCNQKMHLRFNNPHSSGMRSLPEESYTDDEDSVKNFLQIKHRDSVDILVEKFKSKRIQEEQIDEVGEFCCGISETTSCSGMQDLVSNETTREAKSCEDNVDTETCCTRKNSTKELRFNKLADRLKHKSRRSRLTKPTVHYKDQSSST
ncbi:uncharacterized protein [Fopius arisanus]|uniref:Uncharacterized protein n=1 Tax=Fopius arisanus TaxID=64838 RepID=A0A0C9R658_9HYME|nr:PREDICTED: uncharacterized protein LOC105271664 [Fopius arisanus]